MSENNILITAPSLDTKHNVSGISSLVNFIINNNTSTAYTHFELGRKDNEKRGLLWFFRIIKTTLKWMFVVTGKKITLVHFNFALSKPAIIRDAPLVLYAKLIQKKMIIHLHGGDYLTDKKPPAWMRIVLKKVFSGNNPVIVLSPVEQQAVTTDYGLKNVQVLPNCVDLNDAKIFNRSFNSEAVLNMLFIGRITTAKGIEYIYQALSKLKSKQVPFKFYMAGTGPEEKEYVEKFSALLGDGFEFKCVVSGTVKTDLFKQCDIFLLPSLFEGLPISLLESMSFGLVPVVTGVGSIKHVVTTGQNGVLVDSNPVEDTVLAIENFNNDKALLQKLSINAVNFIFENYNPDVYLDNLNKIYDAA
jgi:glycosyltransferase involved in cell wall biosynthesis